MVNSIETSNVNPIQMFNAINSFKALNKPQEQQPIEVSEGININDANILKNQNLEEIKTFAKTAGESNLSNEDIQYGLTYGRSVIADYVI